MRLLRKTEYLSHALKSQGNTRVNHVSDDCKGSSLSMVVSTLRDGSVSAKCFRCGGRGFHGVAGFVSARPEIAGRPYSVSIPYGAVDWSGFPKEARHWLMKSHIGEVECGQFGIKWSAKFNTLVIPIDGQDGKLVGTVHRGFFDAPRYRMLTTDGDNCFLDTLIRAPSEALTTVVVVEDCISAIRCRSAGFASVAMLGINLRKGIKELLAVMRDVKVVVWLDNDTSRVKCAATAIKKELGWLDVKVVRDKTDPKHYSMKEIQETLWKV